MTYLRPHNRADRSKSRLIIIVVIIIVISVVIIRLLWPHLFSAMFTTLAAPFWRIEFSMDQGSLRSPESLLVENEALKRTIEDISIRSQSAQSIAIENEELKALLGRGATIWPYTSATTSSSTIVRSKSSSVDSTLMLAAVLKHPPLVPFDELIIDIGSEDGVAVGNKVYAVGNVIIGRVVDVLGNTSKVSLLSSPGESFSSIVGAGKISGTAFGRGGGQYEISLPRDTVVSIGDVVSVPSIDHQIVGIVSAIIKDPAEPFQKVIFIPPMNIYDARWVFVSKKK